MLNRNYRTLSYLGLSLLLSACGGGSGSLGDSPTLSGAIQGWTLGSGYSLQAELTTGALTQQQRVIATGTIDPQGVFSITLPGAAVMNQYAQYQSTVVTGNSGCNGTISGAVSVSPDPLQAIKIAFYAAQGTTHKRITQLGYSIMATQQASTQSSTQVTYYFSPGTGTASGQVTCTSATGTVRAALSVGMSPGWNSIVTEAFAEKQNTGMTNGSTSLYSGPAPSQAQWTLN
jgi:hypothetical protein